MGEMGAAGVTNANEATPTLRRVAMGFRLLPALLLCTSTLLVHFAASGQEPALTAAPAFTATFAFTCERSESPTFRLEVYVDGRVLYTGGNLAKENGVREYRIPKGAAARLTERVRRDSNVVSQTGITQREGVPKAWSLGNVACA
jgi:hypothetical protein